MAAPLATAEDGSNKPDFSPSNTYLETSFEGGAGVGSGDLATASKVAPPTLPKPRLESETISTLDRKIRNITQV